MTIRSSQRKWCYMQTYWCSWSSKALVLRLCPGFTAILCHILHTCFSMFGFGFFYHILFIFFTFMICVHKITFTAVEQIANGVRSSGWMIVMNAIIKSQDITCRHL